MATTPSTTLPSTITASDVAGLNAARAAAVANGGDPYAGNLSSIESFTGYGTPPANNNTDLSVGAGSTTYSTTPAGVTSGGVSSVSGGGAPAPVTSTSTNIYGASSSQPVTTPGASTYSTNPGSSTASGSGTSAVSGGTAADIQSGLYGAISTISASGQNNTGLVRTVAGTVDTSGTSSSSGYQPTPTFMALGNPLMLNAINTANNYAGEVADAGNAVAKLQEELQDQSNNFDLEAMNLQAVIYGTPDDIRQQISQAGGFATESQVQGIADASNRDLIKQYNALEMQKAEMADDMNAQIGISTADLNYAQAKYSAATNLYQTYASLQSNSVANINDMVTKIGYSGIASITTPDEQASIESAMGWPSGFLSNPPQTQSQITQQIALERLSLAGGSITLPDGSVVTYSAGSPTGTVTSPSGTTTTIPATTPTAATTTPAVTTSTTPPNYDPSAVGQTSPDGIYVSQANPNGQGFVWQAASSAATATTTPVIPTGPAGITQATGLSLQAFNLLTQGTGSMSRMPVSQRNTIMAEVNSYLDKSGIDISTFQTRYNAYNTVLSNNITRYNQTSIMEGEFTGTAKNLDTLFASAGANFGDLNVQNVESVWAGKQVNDPLAVQVAFQLQGLRNDYAGYLAASRGDTQPSPQDLDDASQVIAGGLDTGSADAFAAAMTSATEKNKTVLDNTILDTNYQIWNLFGQGDKYSPTVTLTDPSGSGKTWTGSLPYDTIKEYESAGSEISGLQ